jgi:hypothetical protein
MIQAGDIRAMQLTRRVRFTHQGTVYEGYVQWIEDNDSIMSHERNHPGCVSLVLDTGQSLNDLPKSTAVEKL